MKARQSPRDGRIPSLFLEFKSIGMSKRAGRKPCSLRKALHHNRRVDVEAWGEHSGVNILRTPFNVTLFGNPDIKIAVRESTERIRRSTTKTLRRDYVQAVEFVTSLPIDVEINLDAYFASVLQWTQEQFSIENVISADVHKDQSAVHCHLLVLPITDGRYTGSSTISGTRFTAIRRSFEEQVGGRFGLRYPVRISAATKSDAVKRTMNWLRERSDPVLRSQILSPVEQAIRKDPRPFMMELGIGLSSSSRQFRTMAQIFTSTGKGPRRQAER